jgi:membrane protein YqaA with SNARE-associated domain
LTFGIVFHILIRMIPTVPKKWQFVILSLLLATAMGIITYYVYPRFIGLVFLFFYIIPSNSFVPFPHEPAIIYYGKIFGPLVTTLTAVIPTIIACIIDYAVLTPVFSRTRLAKIKNTGIYQKTVHYYHKAPFFTNMFAALSPLPFYPVRILSVASGYPLWKYTSAVLVGRIPRYYFLALFGAVLNIPNWIIAAFFLSLITAPLYRKLSRRRIKVHVETLEETILEKVIPVPEKEFQSTIKF